MGTKMKWVIEELNYKQLSRLDIEQMHEIELSCKDDPTPIIENREKFEEYLGGNTFIFLLKADRKVIGYTTLEREANNVWYLQNLAVRKEYRNLGWGKVLIKLRNAYAIERGAALLYRHTGVENEAVNKMYEKLGFSIARTLEDHFGKGHHAYVMSKVWGKEINGV